MDEQKKKILIGALLVLVALAGAFALYYFFFKAPPPEVEVAPPPEEGAPSVRRPGLPPARPGVPGVPVTPAPPTVPEAPEAGVLPPGAFVPLPEIVSPIATGGLTTVTTLTTANVAAPARAANGRDVAYYNRDEGKFYRITPDGKPTALSPKVFPNVEHVAWAPTTEQAVLEFPDGSNVLYNFEEEKQVTLPKHWTEFSFAPTGDAIAFKTTDAAPEDRWLAIANPDGSSARPIEPLGNNGDKVTVNWSPNQQMIATFVQSRDAIRQELLFLGKNQENFRLAVLDGRQFTGIWTPEGDRMLYSVATPANDYKPSLWIVDAAPGTSGENRQALELNTWADKCTFANDNVTAYCAVPKELAVGAGLVRDVARETPDAFYRIDTRAGTKSFLANPSGDEVTATNLVLSNDGRFLYFTDARSGQLKNMRLQ